MAFDNTASDEELAHQLNKGSHKAFDEIMIRYKARLYSFICRYVADRDEAYDLLQESFINIYKKIHLYDQNRKFSTWAFQIALNKCRDWGRKKAIARVLPFSSFNKPGDIKDLFDNKSGNEANPEQILIWKTELESIAKAVKNLPDKLKTPLIMCVLEGMPHEECAKILGVSSKTIETRIYRARKKLDETANKF
tara:strand:+ start:9372 stop:9953 length:582 start_codon:yes stop_codon:yes gene_type:complete